MSFPSLLPNSWHCGECSCNHKLLSSNPYIQYLWTIWFWMFLPVAGTLQSLALSNLVNSWSSMKQLSLGKDQVTCLPFGNSFPHKIFQCQDSLEEIYLKRDEVRASLSLEEGWSLQGERELHSPESCSGLGSRRSSPRIEKEERNDGGARNTELGSETENQRLNWKWKEGKFFYVFGQMHEWRKNLIYFAEWNKV